MISKVNRWWHSFFDIDNEYERSKIILLGLIFFFVVGSYTVAREFKDSVFISVVGRTYIPLAKMLSMFILIPAILFYAKLVDKLRRYQLLKAYSVFYGVTGLLFAYLLGHPLIGIANTDQNPYRLFGWIFYFFIEGFSPFVLSVFWAFTNSISSPDTAKKGYGIMIALSKLGGMLTAGISWFLLHKKFANGLTLFSDVTSHQLILAISSGMLLMVPFLISYLMRKVPGYHLHGYEAAYQFEKTRSKEGKAQTGMFSGLRMFLKYPYVLGIFSMLFFYEMFNMVLNYQRLHIAQNAYSTISGVTGFLFQQMFATHMVGFFIAVFGTGTLLRWLGERKCLLLIPSTTALFVIYLMLNYTPGFLFSPESLLIAYVGIRSINYAFSYPVRESLYIPTVKEMKFKSKSWIDAFGTRMAKALGHSFNAFAETMGVPFFFGLHAIFFSAMIGLWFVSAYLLGRRFQWAVDNNEVIGKGLEDCDEEPCSH